MREISQKRGEVSSRVRFMLQDVIELRQNKWVPRRDDSNPKTMDQIQKGSREGGVKSAGNSQLGTTNSQEAGRQGNAKPQEQSWRRWLEHGTSGSCNPLHCRY
ncbi:hypothetical protein L9F63_012237 [Diploptera punctata]|uniref:Eukaryotic translation initiation factor 4 gamma 1 n=1 Tax=Diploptera punctata TaxID=6984 RepID=A0AAD8ADR3_DIPPU|nr:hypothetical protein L9F63_012237 [Diploptera punctata]